MVCRYIENCGGCPYRKEGLQSYRQSKQNYVTGILAQIKQPFRMGNSVFIEDATRRRASMAFCFQKGSLTLGFNAARSNEITDIGECMLLVSELNAVLPGVRVLLEQLCRIPYQIRQGKKVLQRNIAAGDVWLCKASNGIDIVLEYDAPLSLEHRMIIFEQAQSWDSVIRISHRRNVTDVPEPIIEKAKPFIQIGRYNVYIPGGTFLQPSESGEQALAGLVLKYLGETRGKIADLFCGVGTFSYYLSELSGVKILAADSSGELLSGFRESINRNMIPNIEVICKNLFKYPLDETDFKGVAAVVIDPPRAGASSQVQKIAAIPVEDKPDKIIAVSCNPHTFVNDANTLIGSGYCLQEVTLVDQFVYSNHSELVALFTKG